MSRNISNQTAYLATTALLLLGLAVPAAHAARTFCCVDGSGQRSCGDVLPKACRNSAYVEYNEEGTRVRNVEAPLSEAQQAARDAEVRRKAEIAAAEESRRRADQALLNTYVDEKDLDTARDRVVVELQRSIKSGEQKMVDMDKTKKKLAAEAEFFQGKPLPQDLKQKIARNQEAMAEQQAAIDERKKEIAEAETKFEGYRKRLRDLRAGGVGK